MLRPIGNFFSKNRNLIPLMATAFLALAAYGIGAYFFVGMRNPQVFFNLFRNSSFLLISGIGMTFVILTGGIDLSVSGVVALTTVASAVLLREGWDPWNVILLMLAMGMTLGAIMGSFIVYMKVQPFIATLAGMWFARGMCFFIAQRVSMTIHFQIRENKNPIPADRTRARKDPHLYLHSCSIALPCDRRILLTTNSFWAAVFAIGEMKADEQAAVNAKCR